MLETTYVSRAFVWLGLSQRALVQSSLDSPSVKSFLLLSLSFPVSCEGLVVFSHACPFQSSFVWSCPSTFVIESCPTSFLCQRSFHSIVSFDPLSDAFDVLDFASDSAGDLIFLLQHHVFNLFFRQGSVVFLTKTVQSLSVECFFFSFVSFSLHWIDQSFRQSRDLQWRNFGLGRRLTRKTFFHERFAIRNFLRFLHLFVRHRRINCQLRFLGLLKRQIFLCLSTRLQIQVPKFRIFLAWLSCSSDCGIEKCLTPGGTFPLWICWTCCTKSWYLSFVRISLLVSLKNLDATFFRSSVIVFSKFESRLSVRFPWLSDKTFTPKIWSLSHSFSSEFLSPNLQLSEHPLGWSSLVSFPRHWKLRSFHRQDLLKQPRQWNVQSWSRWEYVHLKSTQDLLLILNQVRTYIVLNRNKNRKITIKTIPNSWSKTHVYIWYDTIRKEYSRQNEKSPKLHKICQIRICENLTSSQPKLSRFWTRHVLRSFSDAERIENEIQRKRNSNTVQERKKSKKMHVPGHKSLKITSANCDKRGHVKAMCWALDSGWCSFLIGIH